MDANYLDIGIAVLVLISAIIGFVRGFVREALSLTTWVAAIVLAFFFADKLATMLPFNIANDLVRLGVSFLLIFIGVLVLGSLLNFLLAKAISAIGLGGVDRILGGAFGVLRGGLIVTLIVLIMGMGLTKITESELWQSSKLLPKFEEAAAWVKEMIPPDLAEKIKQTGSDMGAGSSGAGSSQ
jgi:membrane protein required for colicin V production